MNKKPNVIVICADDLGYGDISCYGASELETPNIDSLLDNGIKFNSGYSTSAVCTPARYSLLTGEYPFRNPNTYILPADAACIIAKEKMTLPKIFKQANYNTAIIGKWHLGLGNNDINWNEEITHTPNDVGFDYSFIFPATNDRVPNVYMRNRLIQNLDKNDPLEVSYATECPYDDIPTYDKNPELLKIQSSHGHAHSIHNGYGRIGYVRGGESAKWRDEDLAEDFINEIKGYINENKENPFFLFYTPHQPHVPRIPNEKFAGKSKIGARGDVILELDWCIGELVKHLEETKLIDDTIIIFTSDNGPVLDDGYLDNCLQKNGIHRPAGPLRGGKYSKFEGGARVPFIVSWKNNIKKATSDEIVSQIDFASSFASMLGINVEKGDCPDSQNMLNLLLGVEDKGREDVLFESGNKAMVLRKGRFAYLSPSEGFARVPQSLNETGNSLDPQLYNLYNDISQQTNVAYNYQEISKAMSERIDEILHS